MKVYKIPGGGTFPFPPQREEDTLPIGPIPSSFLQAHIGLEVTLSPC